jgi:hypothetical protein
VDGEDAEGGMGKFLLHPIRNGRGGLLEGPKQLVNRRVAAEDNLGGGDAFRQELRNGDGGGCEMN